MGLQSSRDDPGTGDLARTRVAFNGGSFLSKSEVCKLSEYSLAPQSIVSRPMSTALNQMTKVNSPLSQESARAPHSWRVADVAAGWLGVIAGRRQENVCALIGETSKPETARRSMPAIVTE